MHQRFNVWSHQLVSSVSEDRWRWRRSVRRPRNKWARSTLNCWPSTWRRSESVREASRSDVRQQENRNHKLNKKKKRRLFLFLTFIQFEVLFFFIVCFTSDFLSIQSFLFYKLCIFRFNFVILSNLFLFSFIFLTLRRISTTINDWPFINVVIRTRVREREKEYKKNENYKSWINK